MPEMPEVEVTRRGIAGPLRGARVVAVRLGKPLRWPLGRAPDSLAGCTVGDVARRGKYLWLPLQRVLVGGSRGIGNDTARDEGGLLMHLGMSGSLAMLDKADVPAAGAHDHFDLVTDRGTLRLNDPRRFGAVLWSASTESAPAEPLLRKLGSEAFDETLTAATFHAALQSRRAPIKAVLLAGDVVVGAGNIYACEALFIAGIHPALRADRISRPRAARLLQALREVLGRALELGGSSLRDFTDVHGASGAYQTHAAVYGRAGEPCQRCAATVRRIVQGQRATYLCRNCQKR
jgi:formamidopyrimidine-DNA glycosylase